MTLFIKKINKFIKKRRPYKGERKVKSSSKRVCYNYDKNRHFIAQCPYERKKEDNDNSKKFDKEYKKEKKYTKKKSYGQALIGQEWNSSDESSKSESDEVTTIVIKGKTSSSKSLFPNLSKHTCLITKKGRKKVKSNTPSSRKYVISDEDTLSGDNYDSSDDDNPLSSELVKKPNVMIKGLMRQVADRDGLLEQQKELIVQERKISEELKKLLALEKGKVEKVDQELAKSKKATCSLKSSIVALQGQHDVLIKTHQYLEVQFSALWSSTSKTSINDKASTSQVSVKTCDDQIAQENDHLKKEVKELKIEVNKLKKAAYQAPPQDNHSNVVKKLEKGKPAPKIASHPLKKQYQNENDEKVEYVRSVFLNVRRSHINSRIDYKNDDNHKSRVNTKSQKFIKFPKANVQQEKK
jgi:hypothetical protein